MYRLDKANNIASILKVNNTALWLSGRNILRQVENVLIQLIPGSLFPQKALKVLKEEHLQPLRRRTGTSLVGIGAVVLLGRPATLFCHSGKTYWEVNRNLSLNS